MVLILVGFFAAAFTSSSSSRLQQLYPRNPRLVSYGGRRQARTAMSSRKKRKLGENGVDEECSSQLGASGDTGIPRIRLHAVANKQGDKRDDVEMPLLGLGTYKFKKDAGEASRAVLDALSVGIRHIDTAFVYAGEKTEIEIGNALSSAECTVPRSELFLTTKQWRAYHGYDATLKCLNLSLKRLQTDYIDLYLIHWPGPAYNTMARSKDVIEQSPDGPFCYAKDGHGKNNIKALRADTWRAMEDAVFEGKCRAIGVSNFTIRHLEALRETARIWPPAVNQVELHPYNPQTELVAYCRTHGIVVEAYASLGGQDSGKKSWKTLGGPLSQRAQVVDIAKKYNKSPSQVLLRWATDQGHVVIPKSTNPKHMKENVEAVSFIDWKAGLDENDMTLLAELDQSQLNIDAVRLCWIRDPLKHLDFE